MSSLGQQWIIPKWWTFVLLAYSHVTSFLWTKMATVGQHVCNKIQSIWVIGIILFLPIMVSQIFLKENNESINIYQTWPILSQAKELSHREISPDSHTIDLWKFWIFTFVCLIWFLTSHQQSFSYVGTGLPGLNQYYARINVSCSRTTTQWRRWGSNPPPLGLESSTLPLSHWAP